MIFERLSLGIYGANCYIIGCKETKEAIVVDPGGNHSEVVDEINKKNLNLKYIILTHGHADHIGGIIKLKEEINAPILIHKDDEDMLIDANINLSNRMNMDTIEVKPDKLLNDNDILKLGNLKVEILHTPGHTKGSICIKIEDILITGDTLFLGSIGRSDLYGGNHETLIKSIKEKLLHLNDETTIYPGHGGQSTIGFEKKNNPFIR